jgi:hypothetical protein
MPRGFPPGHIVDNESLDILDRSRDAIEDGASILLLGGWDQIFVELQGFLRGEERENLLPLVVEERRLVNRRRDNESAPDYCGRIST